MPIQVFASATDSFPRKLNVCFHSTLLQKDWQLDRVTLEFSGHWFIHKPAEQGDW